MPGLDIIATQLDLFPRPESTPETLTINNYCDYELHYEHFDGASKTDTGVISAGGVFTSPLSGTVLKAYKTEAMTHPVLIEYSNTESTYYDLSLIDCLGRDEEGARTGDTSACAGHEAGLQIGNAQSMTFQCGPGVWCDDQIYLYEVSQPVLHRAIVGGETLT